MWGGECCVISSLHLVAHFLLQEIDRPTDVSGGPVSASLPRGVLFRLQGAPDGRQSPLQSPPPHPEPIIALLSIGLHLLFLLFLLQHMFQELLSRMCTKLRSFSGVRACLDVKVRMRSSAVSTNFILMAYSYKVRRNPGEIDGGPRASGGGKGASKGQVVLVRRSYVAFE